MVDFSHANSQKKYQRQINICHDVAQQIAGGNRHIIGAMIESHLKAGRQDVVPGKLPVYGQSITDGCLAWGDSVPMLDELANAVRARRKLLAH